LKNSQIERVNSKKEEKVALNIDFGKVYVKIRGNQIMRPIRAQMALFEKAGHLYSIKKGNYAITGAGYTHLNKVASINIVTPQKVIVDGVAQPNPHIERNKQTKAIETVNIRKIGIGFSPIGNITIIDKTLFYNVYTYFIQSIQAKMKKVEWIEGKKTDLKLYPDCAITGIADEKPEKEDASWAFFETASPLGIWVNYKDPVIIDCLEEHTQRQRFGDRIAQKIVERNILKDHPAIGITQVQPVGQEKNIKAFVTVYGYRHDFEPVNISEILEQAERSSETIETKAENIEDVQPEDEEVAIKETIQDERSTSFFDEEEKQ